MIDTGDLYRRLSIGPRRKALAELLANPEFTRKVLDHFKPAPKTSKASTPCSYCVAGSRSCNC